MYRIAGNFGELTRSEHLAKESLVNYRSANKLLIVSTNLNGFSLANHGRFAKISPHQPFPLYGIRESTASLASVQNGSSFSKMTVRRSINIIRKPS